MSEVLKLDTVDMFAVTLLAIGMCLLALGMVIDTRTTHEFVQTLADEWTPGFVIDGMLLLVVNRIIRRNERVGVLAQVGSLSNEFALDAVRRARTEGWLCDGSLRGRDLQRARLADADLSGADLRGVCLRFADLRRTCLNHADLRNADLTGANLTDCDLRWANLEGAKLVWAETQGGQFDGAHMRDVDIRFAATDADFHKQTSLTGGVCGGYLRPAEICLVRKSFEHVEAAGETAVALFYSKLFTAYPALQPMFRNSPASQNRKFLQSLKLIVASLDEPEKSIHALEQLGKRHKGYGVRTEHYRKVGEILIATLREALGAGFTKEVEQAWQNAYGLISNAMIYAAESNG
ncbi:MAG: pentapeptide repeat-containing protein [Pseudomonadota bacterium]